MLFSEINNNCKPNVMYPEYQKDETKIIYIYSELKYN